MCATSCPHMSCWGKHRRRCWIASPFCRSCHRVRTFAIRKSHSAGDRKLRKRNARGRQLKLSTWPPQLAPCGFGACQVWTALQYQQRMYVPGKYAPEKPEEGHHARQAASGTWLSSMCTVKGVFRGSMVARLGPA